MYHVLKQDLFDNIEWGHGVYNILFWNDLNSPGTIPGTKKVYMQGLHQTGICLVLVFWSRIQELSIIAFACCRNWLLNLCLNFIYPPHSVAIRITRDRFDILPHIKSRLSFAFPAKVNSRELSGCDNREIVQELIILESVHLVEQWHRNLWRLPCSDGKKDFRCMQVVVIMQLWCKCALQERLQNSQSKWNNSKLCK